MSLTAVVHYATMVQMSGASLIIFVTAGYCNRMQLIDGWIQVRGMCKGENVMGRLLSLFQTYEY